MGREAATVVSCLAALLSSPDLVSGQTGTPCTFTAPTGASINLASLNKAEGTLGTSPLGNFRINPCQKVTLCDAMQTGSGCCMQLNDTQHPGTSRWISCGVTPKQADMSSASARAGIILEDGPSCGYVLSSGNPKLTASISFVCDASATGSGTVSADPTAFLVAPVAKSSGGAPAPGGATKPAVFDPNVFCNLNFTWKTNLVCSLPTMNQQHSSSWGTPIVLLFLGFCGAYFGAFTFWRSKQTGASQDFWKNMPQYELWSSLPAVCKDGANFVMSGGQKQTHYSQYSGSSSSAGPSSKKKAPAKNASKGNKKGNKKGGKDGEPDQTTPLTDSSTVRYSGEPTQSYSEQLSAAPRPIIAQAAK